MNKWTSSIIPIRELFRMALITSPLMGMYSIVPIVLFISSLRAHNDIYEFLSFTRFLTGVSIIGASSFLLWTANISLLYLQVNRFANSIMGSNFVRYVLSYGLAFTVVLVFTQLGAGEERRAIDIGWLRFYPFIGIFTNNTFILLLANLVVSQRARSTLELEKAELEISHLIVQQEQLKQQLHPHFLFNALGTLKILVSKDVSKGLRYCDLLAGYLRRSITLARQNKVSVKDDLSFCQDYITLQRIRFQDAIQFRHDIPEDALNQGFLPVFCLQMLAENAIKHNRLSASEPLTIVVQLEEGGWIVMRNNRLPLLHPPGSTHVGLANLKKRFEHFSEHVPVVTETNEEFSVTVKVLDQ